MRRAAAERLPHPVWLIDRPTSGDARPPPVEQAVDLHRVRGVDNLPAERPRGAENSAATPTRILAVDDHSLVREGIAGLAGKVAEAASGREAIEQFRAHRPDVTLVEIQMPEMTRPRRAHQRSHGVPGCAQ